MTATQDALDALTKAVDYRKRLIFGNFPASPHVLIGLDEADAIIAALTRLAELEKVAEGMEGALEKYAEADIIFMGDKFYEYSESNIDLTAYAPVGTAARKALAAYHKLNGEKE